MVMSLLLVIPQRTTKLVEAPLSFSFVVLICPAAGGVSSKLAQGNFQCPISNKGISKCCFRLFLAKNRQAGAKFGKGF